ncbi:MAG: DUF4129 domain-containing protein [Candidatus Limnocylindrales bacterium]
MRWSSALDALPVLLDAVVEAAWIAIAYLVLQVLGAHGPILLGPIQFALLAAAGLLLERDVLPWGGGAVAALAVAAALAGWMLSPAVRDALLANDLSGALGLHAGGWLAGVAVVRGAMHGRSSEDDEVVGRLLAWGLPALAIPWLLAQVVAPATRAAFAEPAFVATLTFVVTALLSLAIARLDSLARGTGVDWRRNRSWLLVLALVVVGAVLAGLPLAAVLGVPLQAAVVGALGPLWIVLVAVVALLAIPAGLLAASLAAFLRAFLHPAVTSTQTGPVGSAIQVPQGAPGSGLVFGVVIAALLLGALAILALRLWPGRGSGQLPVAEERDIVIPEAPIHVALPIPKWRRPGRAAAPVDAVGAYVAALDLLAAHPDLARGGDETPAAHVRRLRRTGRGMRPLDRLAADYQVARYVGRSLTRAENRRGVARWAWLRAALGRSGAATQPRDQPAGRARRPR